jgi:hypothetical protein
MVFLTWRSTDDTVVCTQSTAARAKPLPVTGLTRVVLHEAAAVGVGRIRQDTALTAHSDGRGTVGAA